MAKEREIRDLQRFDGLEKSEVPFDPSELLITIIVMLLP